MRLSLRSRPGIKSWTSLHRSAGAAREAVAGDVASNGNHEFSGTHPRSPHPRLNPS
jgi:hypothetical protein